MPLLAFHTALDRNRGRCLRIALRLHGSELRLILNGHKARSRCALGSLVNPALPEPVPGVNYLLLLAVGERLHEGNRVIGSTAIMELLEGVLEMYKDHVVGLLGIAILTLHHVHTLHGATPLRGSGSEIFVEDRVKYITHLFGGYKRHRTGNA